MNKIAKVFLVGFIVTVLGFEIVRIIKTGEVQWSKYTNSVMLTFLLLFFKLGASLYKNTD